MKTASKNDSIIIQFAKKKGNTMSSSAASTPSFEIGVKIVDGQPVVFATGELPARLAEQVAGHLLELAQATRKESRGDFFG